MQQRIAQQRDFLARRLREVVLAHPRFQDLNDTLLSRAGRFVVPVLEEHLGALLERGSFLEDHGITFVAGEPSRCHANSAALFRSLDGAVEVWTGWALSADELWRQHSWCVQRGMIIETTEPRTLYWGIRLTGALLDEFVDENF